MFKNPTKNSKFLLRDIKITKIVLNNVMNNFIIFVPYCSIYRKYIIDCLKSIENQKYSNYEVIIINDGANDTNEINNFIKDKSQYILLNFEKNNGPAFSKWKFIEYIQNNLGKYNVNDICIIVDGDDYLLDNALNIINNTYNNTKCWCIWFVYW